MSRWSIPEGPLVHRATHAPQMPPRQTYGSSRPASMAASRMYWSSGRAAHHLLPACAQERHVHGRARALVQLALGQVDGVARHLVLRADDEGGSAAPRGGLGRERPARERDARVEAAEERDAIFVSELVSARREECRAARWEWLSRRLCGTFDDSEIANLWFAMSGANVDRSDRSETRSLIAREGEGSR